MVVVGVWRVVGLGGSPTHPLIITAGRRKEACGRRRGSTTPFLLLLLLFLPHPFVYRGERRRRGRAETGEQRKFPARGGMLGGEDTSTTARTVG